MMRFPLRFPHVRSWRMKRWTLEAAIHIRPFSFTKSQRDRILREIAPKPDAGLAAKLIEALEGNVSYYKARDNFEHHLAPRSHVRRVLTRAARAFQQAERVSQLFDYHTRFVLAPYLEGRTEPSHGLRLLSARKPPEMAHLEERLCNLGHELGVFAKTAGECLENVLPARGGPRVRMARELFAVDIADTLCEFVPDAVPIVTTEGKPYENIVQICLEAADQKLKCNTHRLLLDAVPLFHSDYRPQGKKSLQVQKLSQPGSS